MANKKNKNKNKNNLKPKSNQNKNKDKFQSTSISINTKGLKIKKKKNKQRDFHNLEEFKNFIENLGLRIKEVEGDGNCFFRSISDQLVGSENNHREYRDLACNYIENNKEFLKFFMEDDKPIDEYLEEMKKDSTWGGNIEIYSLSMCLNINFYIFIFNMPMYIVKNHESPNRNIFLSYHNGEHYNSIRLKDDFVENEVPPQISLEFITNISSTQNSNALNDQYNNFSSSDEACDSNINNIEEDINKLNIKSTDKKEYEQTNITNSNNNIYISNKKLLIDDYIYTKYKELNIGKLENIDSFIEYIMQFANTKTNTNIQSNNIQNTRHKKKQDNILYKKNVIKDKILTEQGSLIDKPLKKCHCYSGKKYRNCHESLDIQGSYIEEYNIFFCNIDKYNNIFNKEEINKNSKATNYSNTQIGRKGSNVSETSEIRNKLELIYI